MKKLVLICSFLFLFASVASAGDYILMFDMAFGAIDVEKAYTFTEEKDDSGSYGGGLYLGYEFNLGFLVQAGGAIENGISLFGAADHYSLAQQVVMAGYVCRLGKYRIIPKIGYSEWKLSAEEGKFLHPGEEAQRELEGHDVFGMLTLKRMLTDEMGMYLSYMEMDPDFGDYRVVSLGVDVHF